jgi:hypothetical protein
VIFPRCPQESQPSPSESARLPARLLAAEVGYCVGLRIRMASDRELPRTILEARPARHHGPDISRIF